MCCCKRTFLLCNDDNKTSKVEKLFRDQTKNSKETPTSIISTTLHEFQYRKIVCMLICINWKQGNKIDNTLLKNHFSTCYSKHFYNNVSIIYCLRFHEEEIKRDKLILQNVYVSKINGFIIKYSIIFHFANHNPINCIGLILPARTNIMILISL